MSKCLVAAFGLLFGASCGVLLASGGGGCGGAGHGHGCDGSAEVSFDTDFWAEQMTTTVRLAGFRFMMNQGKWGMYSASSAARGGFLGQFRGETVAINVFRLSTSPERKLESWKRAGWRPLYQRKVMTSGGVEGLKVGLAKGRSSFPSRVAFFCRNDEGELILFEGFGTQAMAELWRADGFLMDKLATGKPLANNLLELIAGVFRRK